MNPFEMNAYNVLCDISQPEFCSLDHVSELPAEHGDPFEILARRESETGIPLALDLPYWSNK